MVTGEGPEMKAQFLILSFPYLLGKRSEISAVHIGHKRVCGGVSTQSCSQISKYSFGA